MDSEPELKLMSLITQLYDLGCLMRGLRSCDSDLTREFIALSIQIISLVRSMDLESELMSLISQTINVFKSIDLDSQPKQLQDFIQLISEKISLPNSIDSYLEENSDFKLLLLIEEIVHLDPELISLISQILSLVISESERETKPQTELELASERETKPESEPQTELDLELVSLLYQLRHLGDTLDFSSDSGSISMYVSCMIQIISLVCSIDLMSLISQIISCFKSMDLDSQPKPLREFIQLISPEIYLLNNSTEPNSSFKASLEIKHPLHPKHTLQLALFRKTEIRTRECYCCDKELQEIFYYCSACDYAMNIVCVKKPPVLSIDRSKWHEHPLALFPRLTSLTCNLCALSHSRCPFYMCPPCNLVVHQSCINLPRVIRISRHPHRISFTSSFDQGDWSCGVCRRNIDNNYGGFACIKDSCSYAAHSKCATQNNVWDGVELENVPEEVEEEVIEPFVRISDGIIQHFRHQQHHLRLDMNTGRDYDQNKQCQACFTPIYFGNLYSCIQCDYILHEQCAELSRKIHHPIHPHLLTLVGGYNGDMITKRCSACYGLCIAEFFYSCGENGCDFQHCPHKTVLEEHGLIFCGQHCLLAFISAMTK